ncbi:MAG: 16S rRNA (guanine(527)-N(7))-methyltransferase RsmG [Nitrospiraceae bacterium]|nr:16S rRNA (guanine(527)-N(7))-methyltransferase RsmG [Nitrospiraceae bacterium]
MNEQRQLLTEGLEAIGAVADEEAVSRLLVYLGELRKWNKAHNLTSIKDDAGIIEKHFLDSALYIIKGLPAEASAQDFWAGKKVLDVGSGAGFPGIVMKILEPRINIWLMEPAGKKAAFLRHVIRTLGLSGAAVLETGTKEYSAREGRQLYDVVVTRALFKAGEFVKQCLDMTAKGGYMIMSKGPGYEEELKDVSPAPQVIFAGLPFSKAKRFFIVFRNE